MEVAVAPTAVIAQEMINVFFQARELTGNFGLVTKMPAGYSLTCLVPGPTGTAYDAASARTAKMKIPQKERCRALSRTCSSSGSCDARANP